jgi:glycine/D-amino acid oxidase-like deaminating enzyme
MKTVGEADVVVVGAGAVGCSIAYQLRKRGKNVVLVDKGEPGSGTSSTNFGLVWSHTKEPHTYMELNLASGKLMAQMVEELGEDVELRMEGGLRLCLTEDIFEQAAVAMERQSRSPRFRGRMLSTEEVREMQPGVSPKIAGASYSPDDGDVNWAKWTMSLVRGCERSGVVMKRHTEVVGFELDPDGAISAVLTDQGRIETGAVVNSAGPWAKRVAAMAGVGIDVYPLRGQVLITEPVDIVCPKPMSTVRQDRRGQFLMGSTNEDVGFDWTTTEQAAGAIRENAAKLVPATADAKVVRHFSGLRPQPRDDLPLLGAVPRVPGFYIAVSHSGITLSPMHGKVISELIVDGHTDVPIEDYDPLRFEKAGTVERPEPKASGWTEAVG